MNISGMIKTTTIKYEIRHTPDTFADRLYREVDTTSAAYIAAKNLAMTGGKNVHVTRVTAIRESFTIDEIKGLLDTEESSRVIKDDLFED